jgi:hypothetical protein
MILDKKRMQHGTLHGNNKNELLSSMYVFTTHIAWQLRITRQTFFFEARLVRLNVFPKARHLSIMN